VGEPDGDSHPRYALIPLHGRAGSVVAYALIDEQDAPLVAGRRWYLNPDGYACRREGGVSVYMHRLLAEAPRGAVVDHINRNRLDNRRANLRLTDWVGNARNRRPGKRRYRGIRQVGSFWGIRIRHEGLRNCLRFETAEDAALAYDVAAIALFGVEAPTNFDYGEGLQWLDEAGRELLSKVAPDWLDQEEHSARSRQLLAEVVASFAEGLRV
jgi:hypothetical protein